MKERKNVNDITDEVLTAHEQYLREEERSRVMAGKYLRGVRKFREYLYLSGEAAFQREQVLAYKQCLNEHYKTTNASSMLAAINSFFDHLGWGECKVKLFRIQCVRFSEKEKELTEKDYERLVYTAERKGDTRMSMLLQTIGSTGIRINELWFITVESLETGRADIYSKGKSRIVLLPVELVKVLKKYCRRAEIRAGSILITRSGKMMDRSSISKWMKQLGREAGVDTARVSPYNFRHLSVRAFYSIKKDVVRLMDLPGHSNISTTRTYIMSTEEQPRW